MLLVGLSLKHQFFLRWSQSVIHPKEAKMRAFVFPQGLMIWGDV